MKLVDMPKIYRGDFTQKFYGEIVRPGPYPPSEPYYEAGAAGLEVQTASWALAIRNSKNIFTDAIFLLIARSGRQFQN